MKVRKYLFSSFKTAARQLWDIDEAIVDHLYFSTLAISSIALTSVADVKEETRNFLLKMIPPQKWEQELAFPFRKAA